MATLIDMIRDAYSYGQAGSVTIQPQESDDRFVRGRTYINRRIKRLATTREFQIPNAFEEFEISGNDFTDGQDNLRWDLPSPANPVNEIDELFLSQNPSDVVRLLYTVGSNPVEARYLIVERATLQTPRLLQSVVEQANRAELKYNGAAAFWDYKVYLSGLPNENITEPRLLIPHYRIPTELVNATDEFNLLEDTSYIVFAAAADIAANNPITRDLYQNLLADARDAFDDLKSQFMPARAVPLIRSGIEPLYRNSGSNGILSSDIFINSEGQAVDVSN